VSAVALRVTTTGFVVAIRVPSESPCCKRLLDGDLVTFPEHNPKLRGRAFNNWASLRQCSLYAFAPRSPIGGREGFFSRLGWSVWRCWSGVKEANSQLTLNLQALQDKKNADK